MKVLILGVNGFIGNALTERILQHDRLGGFGPGHRLATRSRRSSSTRASRTSRATSRSTRSGSSTRSRSATWCCRSSRSRRPRPTSSDPLAVFELDFEENLRIVKQAVRYRKRVVFPSTSEVYGMCPDAEFDEETSPLVYGPIQKQRWIYSCSQAAPRPRHLGLRPAKGLQFTLFRPFNWFGPHLDDIDSPKEGSSRVLTQFLHNILYGEPIKLVDGGTQRRSFTYISDGIDALMKILENRGRRGRRRHLQHRQPRQRPLGPRARREA